METQKKESPKGHLIRNIILVVLCSLILGAGFTGMNLLSAAKKGPAPKQEVEKKLVVSTIPVQRQDAAMSVKGYGQAYPVNSVEICPEISGKIVQTHPHLDQGKIIQKGEILFSLDSVDYSAELEKAGINVELMKNQISRLTVEFKNDRNRLDSVKRNTQLAKAEFLRLEQLYTKEQVGTLTGVESSEQSYNSLLDNEKTLVKNIELYPLDIAQAQANLSEAKADLATARLNVKRCVIKAPFTGRIKEKSIEKGMYITIGTTALTLVDDSTLEILVPLSDKDAFEILNIKKDSYGSYSGLAQRECFIQPMAGNLSGRIAGSIDRVVKYDSDSRTLYLAIQVDGRAKSNTGIPLMDGMFCKVGIKGSFVHNIVKIPSSSLNQNNTVFLSRKNRLKTLLVNVVMEDGDTTYISADFADQDQIITSQLMNPIENQKLSPAKSPGEKI